MVLLQPLYDGRCGELFLAYRVSDLLAGWRHRHPMRRLKKQELLCG
jgi:hypothetical protein